MHAELRLIVAISALILLPSCGPRKIKKAAFQKAAFSMPSIQTAIDVEQSIVELEAKLTDIPSIIGSRTISIHQVSEQPQQLRLMLECDQSLAEVDAYYAEQMLYNGWQPITSIKDDHEIMQVYKKPLKMCIITLTQSASKAFISFVISDVQIEI